MVPVSQNLPNGAFSFDAIIKKVNKYFKIFSIQLFIFNVENNYLVLVLLDWSLYESETIYDF